MSSAIYWYQDELYFAPPAQLVSSTRIHLSKIILQIQIQTMVLVIGWAVIAGRLEGTVLSQCLDLRTASDVIVNKP